MNVYSTSLQHFRCQIRRDASVYHSCCRIAGNTVGLHGPLRACMRQAKYIPTAGLDKDAGVQKALRSRLTLKLTCIAHYLR